MKYIKYHLVDPNTQIAVAPGEIAPNGKTHPTISGISVEFFISTTETFIATVPDNTVINPASGIVEITEEQKTALILEEFNTLKSGIIENIYLHAQRIREQFVGKWYHHTEMSFAAAIKINQAHAAMGAADDAEADDVAPNIRSEAVVRGITTKQLAEKIIEKFDEMAALESQLAGVRGAKVDVVSGISFDSQDISGSFGALTEQMRDIAQGWL